jgi:hypothetical protein
LIDPGTEHRKLPVLSGELVSLARQPRTQPIGIGGQCIEALLAGTLRILGLRALQLDLGQLFARRLGQRDRDASHRPPLHCSRCCSIRVAASGVVRSTTMLRGPPPTIALSAGETPGGFLQASASVVV